MKIAQNSSKTAQWCPLKWCRGLATGAWPWSLLRVNLIEVGRASGANLVKICHTRPCHLPCVPIACLASEGKTNNFSRMHVSWDNPYLSSLSCHLNQEQNMLKGLVLVCGGELHSTFKTSKDNVVRLHASLFKTYKDDVARSQEMQEMLGIKIPNPRLRMLQ